MNVILIFLVMWIVSWFYGIVFLLLHSGHIEKELKRLVVLLSTENIVVV